jgi:hypothetical protein
MSFEKSELKYLGFAVLAMIVLGIVINVPSINIAISGFNPIVQFLLLNLCLWFILFVAFKYISLGDDFTWMGALGSLLMFAGVDLFLPEYHVTMNGLIPGGVFGMSSTDYFFGYIFNTFFGISGFMLWVFVYPVMFVLIFGLGSLLFKNFIKNV